MFLRLGRRARAMVCIRYVSLASLLILIHLHHIVIISTRGTSEAEGPSAGFITMIANTLAKLPGGVEYDVVYPAAANQDSSVAVANVGLATRVRMEGWF